MISKKNTIIISVIAGAAVIAGGMFGVYKHYVTPERIVGLSLINAGKSAAKTVQCYNNDDERELLERISESGGKTTAEFTVLDSVILDGKDISITSNSDGVCTVSKIGIGDLIELEAYKDEDQMYINTPLFGGGFEIPVKDFAEKWNASIFKNIAAVPEANAFDAYKIIRDNKNGILNTMYKDLGDIASNVSEAGKAKVTVGGKIRNAKVYRVPVSGETYTGIRDSIIEYLTDQTENAAGIAFIKSILPDTDTDRMIQLKIDGLELREIEIEESVTDGAVYTIAFRGKDNPFTDILYYKNDDTKNALRRIHSESSGKLSEIIQLGENTEFTLEEDMNLLKAVFKSDDFEVSLDARGKSVDRDRLSFNNVILKCGELFTLKGKIDFSGAYDDDFSFSKSGQYVNLLTLSQEEWEAITDVVIKGIDLLS